jgi:glycosyltransferase involved in cell wall biosynthesis
VVGPLVTVGIPFLNEEKVLAFAIRSVLRQSVSDFELVLVDDGSTDRSVAIAREFQKDPRVKIYVDGKHRGLPARLNQIVDLARAPLIARMDGDDISHPERLARQLELVKRRPECDAVGTWAALFEDAQHEAFAIVESSSLPPTRTQALEQATLAHATMLARREWLLANRYDESLPYAEDRDLYCRTIHSTFDVIREPLYAIRVGVGEQDLVRSYIDAQRVNRAIFLRHGPRVAGRLVTSRAWLLSHLKTTAMRIAGALDRTQWLVRQRGRPPTDEEARMVREAISSAAVARDDVADLVENERSR